MTGKVYNDPQIFVNGVDLSGDADKASVESLLESVDITPFGAKNKVITPGLGDAKYTIEFFTDWRAGGPNQTLKSMHDNSKNGVAGTVTILADNSASPGTTNYRLSMVAHLLNFTPIDAGVADASKFSAEFVNAGTAGISYGTV